METSDIKCLLDDNNIYYIYNIKYEIFTERWEFLLSIPVPFYEKCLACYILPILSTYYLATLHVLINDIDFLTLFFYSLSLSFSKAILYNLPTIKIERYSIADWMMEKPRNQIILLTWQRNIVYSLPPFFSVFAVFPKK